MDPEQIYTEVLQEEQQKGSSPPVAEGRAKAARQRATEGSPHPKEAKWWPGAQPHLEGGDAAPAEDAEPAEEPAEEPVAEAEPEPEAEPAAAPEREAAPEPEPAAPAETPAAEAPAAAAPAAAPAAEQPAAAVAVLEDTGAMGVSPGTPTGNRLRPEDAVASEAQFAGQRAVEQRRKLIDELIETGVPAVTAAETGRPSSPFVTLVFLLVPILAILFLVNNDSLRESSGGGEETTEEGGGAATNQISAEGLQFSATSIEVTAGEPTEFTLVNDDTVVHDLYIYPDDAAAEASEDALFESPDVQGTSEETFEIPALDAGEYPFLCTYHPAMTGTVTAAEGAETPAETPEGSETPEG